MPRPLSGSMRIMMPFDGTPSGGPDAARELISSAERRNVSASAPSHFATRAYMRASSDSVAADPRRLIPRPRVSPAHTQMRVYGGARDQAGQGRRAKPLA